MDEYKVGDKFIVTLTDVEEMGMGTLYTLDNIIQTDKVGIGRLERIENVPDCHVEQISEPKVRNIPLMNYKSVFWLFQTYSEKLLKHTEKLKEI